MTVLRVIESKRWVNKETGNQVSIYGAVPWTSEAGKANWEMKVVGWTWENSNGTVGLGRPPAKTHAEAVEVMNKVNALSKSS